MQLTVLGVNHNSAPIEIIEKLAVSEGKLESQYRKVLNNDRIYETMILSTCNRVEYYVVTDEYVCSLHLISHILGDNRILTGEILNKHIYIYCGDEK